MASYQRVALFILFDSMETDLVGHLRALKISSSTLLVIDERTRALPRLQRRESAVFDPHDDYELINGLDLGEKYNVLLRHRGLLPSALSDYFLSIRNSLDRLVPVRNATMHGRPLTTSEYAIGFAAASDFVKNGAIWPSLVEAFQKYSSDPHAFLERSVVLLDRDLGAQMALNNLPAPDYEDTGFVPRPALERDLRAKLRGRHPVVTVLGEGGSGKSALALQTLYGMLHTNDHGFDAIVWVSAKSSKLSVKEVERIEGAITTSLGIFEEIADTFEPGDGSPIDRVKRLLSNNRILLIIDNLETVIDESIKDFAADVPGESKLLLTSRVPLGSDLVVEVGDFTDIEARGYIKRLVESYSISTLRKAQNGQINHYIKRLGYRPLLLKWFAFGVLSGLEPDKIIANPTLAVSFCVENIVDQLSVAAQDVATMLAVVTKHSSAAIICHITGLSAVQVESAISELSRFALVDLDQQAKYERAYVLKPFIKAYITRVTGVDSNLSSGYIKKSRQMETILQQERGSHASHRYDRKSYTVRSKTEALAAGELRRAYSRARQGQYDEADSIINILKISTPEYFEIYRTEAFVAYESGDISRAINAYETALELADDQPQLHFWFSGFIQRALEDHSRAEDHLRHALELDPDRPEIIRELARVKFFQYDFAGANEYVLRLRSLEFRSLKDETIAADLEAQLYAREADHAVRNGDYRQAVSAIRRLFDLLDNTDDIVIDRSLVEHAQRVIPALEIIKNSGFILSTDDISLLENKIAAMARLVFGVSAEQPREGGRRTLGELKQGGRQARFAFLVDGDGEETFVHKTDTTTEMWDRMCGGEAVFYTVVDANDGRTRAVDIVPRSEEKIAPL